MDYTDPVSQIIDRASQIVLPQDSEDIVSIARSQFSQFHYCDAKYVESIEGVIAQILEESSWEQKDQIWRSLDTSAGEPFDPDEIYPGIDLTLQIELLDCVTDELSGA
jgi:hypothetical protein